MDPLDLSVSDLCSLYGRHKLSPKEVLRLLRERLDAQEARLHAYLYINEDLETQAEEAESRIMAGNGRPLEGVFLSLKDNLCTRDQPTTCASKALAQYRSPYDATVITRLKEAGALIVGKTNLDEFAIGSSTETSAFGPTRNPLDERYVPGGSSGGAAASVAARLAFGALGSDTGGSLRQPASFCGVVGMKPTWGRVSRYGLVGLASSLDQVGPMARNVEDCAILLSTIAGKDPMDSTSSEEPVPDYLSFLSDRSFLKDLKIGIPVEWMDRNLDSAVTRAFQETLSLFKSSGARISHIKFPHSAHSFHAYYIIMTAEASTSLARFDGIRYGFRTQTYQDISDLYYGTRSESFGSEIKKRIVLGTYILSSGQYETYYQKAMDVRAAVREDFRKAFESVDIILSPTTAELPFKFGEKSKDPLNMALSDIFTVHANLAGIPAISVPGTPSDEGLPTGIQYMAPSFCEKTLFQCAHFFHTTLSKERT